MSHPKLLHYQIRPLPQGLLADFLKWEGKIFQIFPSHFKKSAGKGDFPLPASRGNTICRDLHKGRWHLLNFAEQQQIGEDANEKDDSCNQKIEHKGACAIKDEASHN